MMGKASDDQTDVATATVVGRFIFRNVLLLVKRAKYAPPHPPRPPLGHLTWI